MSGRDSKRRRGINSRDMTDRAAMWFFCFCLSVIPAFSQKSPEEKELNSEMVVGTLTKVAAAGGETTGWLVRLNHEQVIGDVRLESIEVDPKPKKLRLDELRGKTVEATGRVMWRGGPERKQRPVLVLDAISIAALEKKPNNAAKPELKVMDAMFEDFSGGLSPQWQMKPGEDIVFSFRVAGFDRLEQLSKDGLREQSVSMHYFIGLLDPAGNAVVPGREGDIETTLSMQDKDWRPKINWTAQMPSSAPAGKYKIQISVTDRIARRETTEDIPFTVVTPGLPQANNGIEVVQLEYSNSENGPWSPERYFAPTDTVWVRYKVIGFQVSPDNQVGVEQDWTVLSEEGKVLMNQSNAAGDNEKSFYPPHFLPAIFALNLKDPKPGKYTLRIDLRDTIAQQNASFESDFFIRP